MHLRNTNDHLTQMFLTLNISPLYSVRSHLQILKSLLRLLKLEYPINNGIPHPLLHTPNQILKNILPPHKYPPQYPLRLNRPNTRIHPLDFPLSRQHPNLINHPAKLDRLERFGNGACTAHINDMVCAAAARDFADGDGPLRGGGVVYQMVCAEGFCMCEFDGGGRCCDDGCAGRVGDLEGEDGDSAGSLDDDGLAGQERFKGV